MERRENIIVIKYTYDTIITRRKISQVCVVVKNNNVDGMNSIFLLILIFLKQKWVQCLSKRYESLGFFSPISPLRVVVGKVLGVSM